MKTTHIVAHDILIIMPYSSRNITPKSILSENASTQAIVFT